MRRRCRRRPHHDGASLPIAKQFDAANIRCDEPGRANAYAPMLRRLFPSRIHADLDSLGRTLPHA